MPAGLNRLRDLYQGKALAQQRAEVKAAKLARAFAGLRDGTFEHATNAAESVGLSAEVVRKAWQKERGDNHGRRF